MRKIIVFDVDGTLIHDESGKGIPDTPRYEILSILFSLKALNNCDIYVWSGGGIDYAQRWCDRLGLTNIVKVVEKGCLFGEEYEYPDIVFDDEVVKLGRVNIKV